MSTFTFTYTVEKYANPFLTCEECGRRAEGYVVAPGHEKDFDNWPCEHRAPITSTCPSWGPVDGCTCQQVFGHVPHEARHP